MPGHLGRISAFHLAVALCLGSIGALGGCTQPYSIQIFSPALKISSPPLDFSTTYVTDYVWLATLDRDTAGAAATNIRNTYVYQIKLDEAAGYPLKSWSLQNVGDGGTRTYMSEVGLLLARQGALFRIDKDTPNGAPVQPIWSTPLAASSRSCVTSYRIDGKPYVGFAWNNSSKRRFTRLPIDRSKPGLIDVAQAFTQEIAEAPAIWGYGCFTDQKGERLWSNYFQSAPGGGGHTAMISGLNLRTLADAPVSSAPNYGKKNDTLDGGDWDLTQRPLCVPPSPLPTPTPSPLPSPYVEQKALYDACAANNPYALSGDSAGNVFAGSATHYVHDSKNGLVYWRARKGNQLRVAKADCFANPSKVCTAGGLTHGVYALGSGPLSGISIYAMASLEDGRIVGLQRLTSASPVMKSRLYVISPVDLGDLSAGLDFKLVKEVDGDAYMYNDFTGSTLYPREAQTSIDLTSLPNYSDRKKVTSISLNWSELGGGVYPWRGFKLMARCYRTGTSAPDYQEVPSVNSSLQETLLAVSSCMNVSAQRMDLKAVPDPAATSYSRAVNVRVTLTMEE